MAEIEIDNIEELQEVIPEASEASEVSETPESPEVQEEKEPVSNKEKLMRSLVGDEDDVDEETAASLRQMLDAAPRWFLSQWKMMLLVLAGVFLYITNGYQAQVEMMKETELEAELKDWRYRSITRVSELTQLCRQSQLEQKLREQGDSTLTPSKVAPFIINVKE
ncbi:MAG: hypothetical protein IJK51_10260 [Bacteroidaceae bacterium]|jgi:hypothetical protein|nr:hypothetical protein [Bacteroidaceae bacterium]